MSFTNPAPLGAYITGNLIDESEINYWCSILPDCIDGAGGGTYTLSNPLIITGDIVEIEDLEADDIVVATMTAGDIVTTTFTVTDINLSGTIFGGGSSAASFSDLSSTGNLSCGGALTAEGNTTLGTTSADTITANATASFLSTLSFRFKTIAGADADTAFTSASAGSIVYTESMSTNRAYTFSGSFSAGHWFLFKHRASGGHTLTVNGAPLTVAQGIFFFYTGSNWRFFSLDE